MFGEIVAVLLGTALLYFFFAPLLQAALCCRNRQLEEHVYQFEDPNELVDGYRPQRVPFPSVFDRENLVYLTVVAPVHNAGRSLGLFLSDAISFLRERRQRDKFFSFEIVLVDDASNDNTAAIVMEFASKFGTDVVRLLRLDRRSGVGFAAKQGALVARGSLVLLLNTETSPNLQEFQALEYELGQLGLDKRKDSMMMGVATHAVLQRPADWLKRIARGVMKQLTNWFASTHLQDVLPGMLLCNRRTAQLLFPALVTPSAAFQAELVYLTSKLSIPYLQFVSDPSPSRSLQASSSGSGGGGSLGLGEWLVACRDVVMIKLGYHLKFWRVPRQQKMMLGPSVARHAEAKVFRPSESVYGGDLSNLNTSMMSMDGDRSMRVLNQSTRQQQLNSSRHRLAMSARKPASKYSRPNVSLSSTPYGVRSRHSSHMRGTRGSLDASRSRLQRSENLSQSVRYGRSGNVRGDSYGLNASMMKNESARGGGGLRLNDSHLHRSRQLNTSRGVLNASNVNVAHRGGGMNQSFLGNLRRSFAS